MKKLMAGTIIALLTHGISAAEIHYQSLEGVSVTFYVEDHLVVVGDSQTTFDTCNELGLAKCLRFADSILHVPGSIDGHHSEPIRYALDEDHFVWSLPVLQKRQILRREFEGYLIYISGAKNSEVLATIFFSVDRGIVNFTSKGTEFWVSSGCGLYASKECYSSEISARK